MKSRNLCVSASVSEELWEKINRLVVRQSVSKPVLNRIYEGLNRRELGVSIDGMLDVLIMTLRNKYKIYGDRTLVVYED